MTRKYESAPRVWSLPDPCPEHPNANRYQTGACSACQIRYGTWYRATEGRTITKGHDRARSAPMSVRRKEPLFYVYLHRDPRTQTVVYVGKGRDGRAWEFQPRGSEHRAWLNTIATRYPFGMWVELYAYGLPESGAGALESHLIAGLRRNGAVLFNKGRGAFLPGCETWL